MKTYNLYYIETCYKCASVLLFVKYNNLNINFIRIDSKNKNDEFIKFMNVNSMKSLPTLEVVENNNTSLVITDYRIILKYLNNDYNKKISNIDEDNWLFWGEHYLIPIIHKIKESKEKKENPKILDMVNLNNKIQYLNDNLNDKDLLINDDYLSIADIAIIPIIYYYLEILEELIDFNEYQNINDWIMKIQYTFSTKDWNNIMFYLIKD